MLIPLKTLVERFDIKPTGVLHVGANIGEESVQYEEQGIKNVIWIEANPDIYNVLTDNVSKFGHRCLNFCAGDENKDVTFHIANNNGQSSSVLELGTHRKNHPSVRYTHDVQVSMLRIDTFFSEERLEWLEGIDFISMDVQGFELQVLKGMGDLMKQFKYVYAEVNKEEVYQGNGLVGEVDQYLSKFGFRPRMEKWTNAKWGDKFYSK